MGDVYFLKVKNKKTNGGDNKKEKNTQTQKLASRRKNKIKSDQRQSLCFNDVAKLISVRMFSKWKDNK